MQFVPARSDGSAHVKAFVEKRPSLPLGAVVCFFVANEELDLLCKEATDRSFTSGSKNFGLLEHLPTQTYCDVLLPAIS
jgi:hypothetical protein